MAIIARVLGDVQVKMPKRATNHRINIGANPTYGLRHLGLATERAIVRALLRARLL